MATHLLRTCARRVLIALLGAAVAACASVRPGKLTAETSQPAAVDPRADNEAVLTDLVPGLVVTLEIDGPRVNVADAQVMMVPRAAPRREEGELVSVTGISAGQAVARVYVPDQRLNVEEGRGIVLLEKRTLHAVLPLPRRIETLEVRLPGADRAQRFDMTRPIEAFCQKNPRHDLCR